MEMTREELVEVMARAMCARQGMYWEDQFGIYPSSGDPSVHEAFKHDAAAALAALEAAGVRLVPSEATHKMADVGTEARWQSAVRDADNVREIWRAMLAASPYAPPGG